MIYKYIYIYIYKNHNFILKMKCSKRILICINFTILLIVLLLINHCTQILHFNFIQNIENVTRNGLTSEKFLRINNYTHSMSSRISLLPYSERFVQYFFLLQ